MNTMGFYHQFPNAIPLLRACYVRVTHPSAGVLLPLDLHVLGLPLAFILSQDQTLHSVFLKTLKSTIAGQFKAFLLFVPNILTYAEMTSRKRILFSKLFHSLPFLSFHSNPFLQTNQNVQLFSRYLSVNELFICYATIAFDPSLLYILSFVSFDLFRLGSQRYAHFLSLSKFFCHFFYTFFSNRTPLFNSFPVPLYQSGRKGTSKLLFRTNILKTFFEKFYYSKI